MPKQITVPQFDFIQTDKFGDCAIRAIALALGVYYGTAAANYAPSSVVPGVPVKEDIDRVLTAVGWQAVYPLDTPRATCKTPKSTPAAFDPDAAAVVLIDGGKHITYVGLGHKLYDTDNAVQGQGLKAVTMYWTLGGWGAHQYWDALDAAAEIGSLTSRYFDDALPPHTNRTPAVHSQGLAASQAARHKALLADGADPVDAEVAAVTAYTGYFDVAPGPRWLATLRAGRWVSYAELAGVPIPKESPPWAFANAWRSTGKPLADYRPHNGVDLLPAHLRANLPLPTPAPDKPVPPHTRG